MNLIWRFFLVMLFSRFAKPHDPFSSSTLRFHVLPTDVDLLMHMNNGRYFSLMDLARINFTIRCGFFARLKTAKCYPVVASEMIRFRKSLPLFQSFEIHTQLLGWDDKFFYIAHYFKQGETLCTLSVVKACFLHKTQGIQTAQAVIKALGIKKASPALPEWLHDWQTADRQFYIETTHSTSQ